MRVRPAASIAVALFVAVGARGAEAPPPDAVAVPDPDKAEGRYKNIQALKGYPADDVVPAMQFITVDESQQNVPVDDKAFEKPAPAPAPPS